MRLSGEPYLSHPLEAAGILADMPRFNVIDLATLGGDQVTFGATVEIEDVDTGEKKKYTLLGPDESEPSKGIISILSPVGQALLGKYEGDEIVVDAPRGKINYEIVSIIFAKNGNRSWSREAWGTLKPTYSARDGAT